MDMQQLINLMNESSSNLRAKYHLTFGELIDALKSAPSKATFDKRIKGIGSWRGSYCEIALFTRSSGISAEKEEYNPTGKIDWKEYEKFQKTNSLSVPMPCNANKLGELLESLLDTYCFVGYKGGHFRIGRNKPLWLEEDDASCKSVPILGIDKNLRLLTSKKPE